MVFKCYVVVFITLFSSWNIKYFCILKHSISWLIFERSPTSSNRTFLESRYRFSDCYNTCICSFIRHALFSFSLFVVDLNLKKKKIEKNVFILTDTYWLGFSFISDFVLMITNEKKYISNTVNICFCQNSLRIAALLTLYLAINCGNIC